MTRRAPADSLAAPFQRPTAWLLAIASFFVVAIVAQSALAITPHRNYTFDTDFSDSGADGADLNTTAGTAPTLTAGHVSGMAVLFDGNLTAPLAGLALNAVGGSTAQGMQMWVRPASGGELGVTSQAVVSDTIDAGGPGIFSNGNWSQVSSGHVLNDDFPAATVAVVPDTWHHVMQHIYVSGKTMPNDITTPEVVSGTGSDNGFTSVLYVDGIAVSANNDALNTDPMAGGRAGYLVVGAREFGDDNASVDVYNYFFDGAVDNLTMYTDDNGTTFNFFVDNEWVADAVAATTAGSFIPGDINFDGNVDQGDIDDFVDGWLSSKVLVGAHNSIYVGDWETYQNGDLNLDGQVNLEDAYLLHVALSNPATGSANGGAVPEPTTLATFLLGAIGLAAAGMRRRRG